MVLQMIAGQEIEGVSSMRSDYVEGHFSAIRTTAAQSV
jgi:hypothetical protein